SRAHAGARARSAATARRCRPRCRRGGRAGPCRATPKGAPRVLAAASRVSEPPRSRYRGLPMPGTVTTTTTELPDSRVRLDVEVAPEAIEKELRSAAQALGRDLKI